MIRGVARGQSSDGAHSVFERYRLILSGFFAQILVGGYMGDTWCLIVSPVVPAPGRREAGLLLASVFVR